MNVEVKKNSEMMVLEQKFRELDDRHEYMKEAWVAKN